MKFYNAICVAAALILTYPASDAVAGGTWIADANGCKIWNPNPKKIESVTWSGACTDGFAEGPGTQQWFLDGALASTFDGSFSGGKRNGKGRETLAKGASFEGEFVDNLPEGKGVMILTDGARYEGDFLGGRRTGKGVIAYKNGNRYEGDFVEGKLVGQGTFTWASGSSYTGDMADGRPNGKGTLKLASGDYYEGDFVDGKRTVGKGTYTLASGDHYTGDITDGKPNGRGTMKLVSGDRDEGNFVDGKLEGKGTTVFANGNRYDGSYSNGKFDGEGKMQYAWGGRYEGTWKAGERDGVGTLFYRDGSRLDGVFPSGDRITTAANEWGERPASFSAKNCAPTYSKAALDAKEEGTVRVQFEIDAHGKLESATIAKSSGFADLDQTTIDALSRCKFKPAIKDGKLAAATLLTDYDWVPIPAKPSPIIAQLKGNEGLLLIDIMIINTDTKAYENPTGLYKSQYFKPEQVWFKNMDTNKHYNGMFNLKKGKYGVVLAVMPEGLYCVNGFATESSEFPWCHGPQIRVNKGVINNAGEWRFARLYDATQNSFSRVTEFKLIGARENPDGMFQRAVNEHPELFEN